jgi:CelD/BcsL family acetyltransferase involved in cellulose biosynthesis
MPIHIATGRSAVSLKIAYDEDYARFSPGVMLQMEYLADGLRLERVDSSARANHPMFDRIWIDRLPIVSLMVPFNRRAARAACAAEQAVRRLAACAKRPGRRLEPSDPQSTRAASSS